MESPEVPARYCLLAVEILCRERHLSIAIFASIAGRFTCIDYRGKVRKIPSRAINITDNTSETTATTLASIIFFLTKYSSAQKKLQSLLDRVMPNGASDWSYEKVKRITFIDDIINETLRLKPALLTGGYRCTPAEGLQVDEVYIPGDVNVFVPPQLIQTDERYYRESHEFIPERWGEQEDMMMSNDAPFYPFSAGNFSSIICYRNCKMLMVNFLQEHTVARAKILLFKV